MLREVILGQERFDYALKTYIERWAYKHPQPQDFFRTINSAAGENLDWFWKGWFLNDWLFDQSVEEVSYVEDKPENGALISLSNHQKLVLPVLMTVVEEDGDQHEISLPVDIWARGNNWTTLVETDSKIKKVVLDEDRMFPDLNRTNNVWEME
jgi:aminopeptidase N